MKVLNIVMCMVGKGKFFLIFSIRGGGFFGSPFLWKYCVLSIKSFEIPTRSFHGLLALHGRFPTRAHWVQFKGFSFNVKFKVLSPSPRCFTPISSTSQLQTERSVSDVLRGAPDWGSPHSTLRDAPASLPSNSSRVTSPESGHHSCVGVRTTHSIASATVSVGHYGFLRFLITRHSLQVCLLSLNIAVSKLLETSSADSWCTSRTNLQEAIPYLSTLNQ